MGNAFNMLVSKLGIAPGMSLHIDTLVFASSESKQDTYQKYGQYSYVVVLLWDSALANFTRIIPYPLP